jgi:adenylate cyclase
MQMLGSADIFLFEGFRLGCPVGGLARLDDAGATTPIPISSRALDLLSLLVKRQGDLVSKDAIMAAVWPGTAVEEGNITVQISALRRLLDRGRAERSCIQTVSGRGYRFIAPVARIGAADPPVSADQSQRDNNSSSAENEEPPTAAEAGAQSLHPRVLLPGKPSVAVLPFAKMAGDSAQQFFADGIAEDISTALSHYPSLFVIAGNSCLACRGQRRSQLVERERGVRYVLEGSMRKAGERIRLAAQLVEAATGRQIWGERYDRELGDAFVVQDEIADIVTVAVAQAIAHAELLRAARKPPGGLDAWDAYQRGLWELSKINPENNALAQRSFRRAIYLDPNFAGGYTGLAWAQRNAAVMFQTRGLSEAQNSAEILARQAVTVDCADAEARSCLAIALMTRADYEGAQAEGERALELTPNLAIGHAALGATLIFAGSQKAGLAHLEKSTRLDPSNPLLAIRLSNLTIGRYFAGDYRAAVDAARRVVRSYPHYPLIYRWLAAALGQLSRTEEAKEALEKAIAIAPASFDIFVRHRAPWYRQEDHAHMLEGLRKAGWSG